MFQNIIRNEIPSEVDEYLSSNLKFRYSVLIVIYQQFLWPKEVSQTKNFS